MNTAAELNVERLEEISLGDEEFLKELVEVFLDDAAQQLVALSDAAAAGDPEQVAGVAHRLKGSSGNVGAEQLQALCAALESDGLAGRPEKFGVQAERITGEFERVRRRLIDHLL